MSKFNDYFTIEQSSKDDNKMLIRRKRTAIGTGMASQTVEVEVEFIVDLCTALQQCKVAMREDRINHLREKLENRKRLCLETQKELEEALGEDERRELPTDPEEQPEEEVDY